MAKPKKRSRPQAAHRSDSAVYAGYHAVFEALRQPTVAGVVYLASDNKKARDIAALADSRGVSVQRVSGEELAAVGGTEARGAVLVGAAKPKGRPRSLEEFLAALDKETAVVLVLEGITDPHNVGAILRSADQFAVDVVVTRARRAAGDTATLSRTSAGASAHVPRVTVSNIGQSLSALQQAGFWVYGAAAEGRRVTEVELSGRIAIVLGAEGEGLTRLTRERCDELVSIPTSGQVDSLNVSVAAGILLYEARRGDPEL